MDEKGEGEDLALARCRVLLDSTVMAFEIDHMMTTVGKAWTISYLTGSGKW